MGLGCSYRQCDGSYVSGAICYTNVLPAAARRTSDLLSCQNRTQRVGFSIFWAGSHQIGSAWVSRGHQVAVLASRSPKMALLKRKCDLGFCPKPWFSQRPMFSPISEVHILQDAYNSQRYEVPPVPLQLLIMTDEG